MIATRSGVPLRRAIALSWSGGKDSSLALAALRADPRYEVVALLTSVTQGYDRISIHGVRRSLLMQQAQRIGLPLYEVGIAPQSSNDAYEHAFLGAVARIRVEHPGVTQIAFGDLFLADVRAYRERLLVPSGCEALFPLWGQDTAAVAKQFVAEGYEAHLVCVDTTRLSMAYAGRRFDERLLSELPPEVDPCGENGEFHTFVSAGPVFSAPVPVVAGEVVLRDERFAYCDFLDSGASPSATPV